MPWVLFSFRVWLRGHGTNERFMTDYLWIWEVYHFDLWHYRCLLWGFFKSTEYIFCISWHLELLLCAFSWHRLCDLTMATRNKLLSDSDILSGLNRNYRRESIADYLTNRRGSLSDLVFTGPGKLSRESLPTNPRWSRNSSITNPCPPSLQRDSKQRSNSVVANPSPYSSQTSIRESRLDRRSSSNLLNGPSGSYSYKVFNKTKSLSSIQTAVERNEESKRKSLANKKRRWMRKFQSFRVFDSVLKGRQNRRRFDVSKLQKLMHLCRDCVLHSLSWNINAMCVNRNTILD